MVEGDRLAELQAKIDSFFARVDSANPGVMRCGSGCHDCCAPGLTVTAIEAAAIRALVVELAPAARAALRTPGRADRCAALGADGRCRIYAARPLVCRSHGVPIRMADERTRLPVITACEKNAFSDPAPADVLDQATVSTILGALDAAAAGGAPGPRVAIAELLAG